MRLPVPQDDEIKRRLRLEQTDPLIMYFVVLQTTQNPQDKLYADAATAARLCADKFGQNEKYQELFQAWYDGSFRKVTLRAKAKRYEDVKALDHVMMGDVICLPPRPFSQREAILKKLQTLQSLELSTLPVFETPDPDRVNLVVNLGLGMSIGKTVAQIGHAALMAGGDANLPIAVWGIGQDQWEEVIDRYPVLAVRDGGLTEIEPGSETVLVIDPPKKSFP